MQNCVETCFLVLVFLAHLGKADHLTCCRQASGLAQYEAVPYVQLTDWAQIQVKLFYVQALESHILLLGSKYCMQEE